MGRLTRLIATLLIAGGLLLALPATPVLGFDGFGRATAQATYGGEMVFRVQLPGGAPDRLELLLTFAGSEETFVAPVSPTGSSAEYRWDTSTRHVTPNTQIGYRWRATDGETTTISPEGSLLYEDDRPGLDWRSARIGDATVHWYGGAESQARRFGELSADGARQAEALLGHQLDGPIDIFVYDSREDFFGALGPGAREWTGAATYPELRTIFMWLGGGPQSYLETTIVHEVTHVVFHDATANPFHEPAKWFNEGFSTWSERQSADQERTVVEGEARSGLFAFPAIAEQFPIGSRGSTLSYAMGATMVGMIIDTYGRDAIARMAAAFHDGASDEQAIRAGTGISAEELYAEYYASFGVAAPAPVEPAALPPSNVDLPGGIGPTGNGSVSSAEPAPGSPAADSTWGDAAALAAVALLWIGGFFLAFRITRRAGRGEQR